MAIHLLNICGGAARADPAGRRRDSRSNPSDAAEEPILPQAKAGGKLQSHRLGGTRAISKISVGIVGTDGRRVSRGRAYSAG